MDIYKFGNCYTYTPDVEIEKKNGKYGIIYLPTNEVILPFEYDNIMINDGYVNNFFIVKNGLFGAVHLEGVLHSEAEMFAERENLDVYDSKPIPVYDLPCEYDYFRVLIGGESIFYNSKENVYLYVSTKNTIIHFKEVFVDDYSVWAKKNDTLYLVCSGEIQYSEPFIKFRFSSFQCGHFYSYIDYENHDRLMQIDTTQRYKLIKQASYLVHNPQTNLCFDGKDIEFEYYFRNYTLDLGGITHNVTLLGICEKGGEHIHITLPFAHTLKYVGMNRFIANCIGGKFSLCEIKYHGQVETEYRFENLYDAVPQFILHGYDYVNCLGGGYYEFLKEGQNIILYNANNGSVKDTF